MCRDRLADPVQEEDLLEFRLLYQGPLPSSSSDDPKRKHKHQIRKVFHPQLRRLWQIERTLRFFAEHAGVRANPEAMGHTTEQQRVDFGLGVIGKQWSRNGYDFVPLITQAHALRCSLDILLLRPEEDKYIFTRGDIDGQLKTVFDALKLPQNENDIGKEKPEDDETPFFTLLEDDRLISEVRVDANQLLLLPGERQVKATDSFVVVHVKLNYKSARTFDNLFG